MKLQERPLLFIDHSLVEPCRNGRLEGERRRVAIGKRRVVDLSSGDERLPAGGKVQGVQLKHSVYQRVDAVLLHRAPALESQWVATRREKSAKSRLGGS